MDGAIDAIDALVGRPMNNLSFSTQVIPRQARRHILHIEDDAEVAASIREVLETKGYKVTLATNGLAGLIVFRQIPERWAAVIIDLDLPHIGGLSLIKEMHGICPELPLIVLTGAPRDTNLELYELGAAILWHKPISPPELLENLSALIETSRNEPDGGLAWV